MSWLLLALLGEWGDAVTTYCAVVSGVGREANPSLQAVNHDPWYAFFVAAVQSAVLLAIWLLSATRARYMVLYAVAVHAAVKLAAVLNNMLAFVGPTLVDVVGFETFELARLVALVTAVAVGYHRSRGYAA